MHVLYISASLCSLPDACESQIGCRKSDPCEKAAEDKLVYLVEERNDLSQLELVENADVIERGHGQDGHAELLPQHAAGGAAQAAQQPGRQPPWPGAAPQRAVAYVTQQRQQEEESGALVGPAHDARHRLGVDGVRGEEEAGQQAPQASSQQQAGQRGEQARHGPVEGYVDHVVAPRLQAAHSVVETEGEGAERPVRLVAAAVREQGAPEVVVEDIGPGGLREQVLIGLDCSAAERKEKVSVLSKDGSD